LKSWFVSRAIINHNDFCQTIKALDAFDHSRRPRTKIAIVYDYGYWANCHDDKFLSDPPSNRRLGSDWPACKATAISMAAQASALDEKPRGGNLWGAGREQLSKHATPQASCIYVKRTGRQEESATVKRRNFVDKGTEQGW
jgi:hypothetical protein